MYTVKSSIYRFYDKFFHFSQVKKGKQQLDTSYYWFPNKNNISWDY